MTGALQTSWLRSKTPFGIMNHHEIIRMLRAQSTVILLLFMTYAHRADAGKAKPSFLVSSFGLGPAGPAVSAEEFARVLAGAGWCEAHVVTRSRWDALSRARDGAVQVSVVTAGFGDQAHAYAFVADRPGKSFTRVAHIPYRNLPNWRGVKEWQRPMVGLANALFDVWERRDERGPERPTASLKVVADGEDVDDGSETLNDLLKEGAAGIDDAKMMHERVAQTAMEPLKAMALGAALEAGWLPDDNAQTTLTVSLRFGFKSCAIRCARSADADSQSLFRPSVPQESYHAQLMRSLRALIPGSGIRDVFRLGTSVAPVVATDERIVLVVDGKLHAYQTTTGKLLWHKPAPRRGPAPRYRSHPDESVVLRLSTPPAVINLTDGAETALPAGQVAALSAPDTGAYVFDQETEELVALDKPDGAERWRREMGDVLVTEPAVCGKSLFVATKGNRLLLLNPADGVIRHEIRWPTWLNSAQVMRLDAATYIVCQDLRGRVAFLNANNLQTAQLVHTGEKLKALAVYAPRTPMPWPGSASGDAVTIETTVESRPAVLIGDDAGFCYALRIPLATRKEGR